MRTRLPRNIVCSLRLFMFVWVGTLVLVTVALENCGGTNASMQSRQLIAIEVQPSNGDATVPGTQPFTAAGTFSQPPVTQSNLSAQWTSSDSTVASIDPNTGLATCLTVGGPVTVTASVTGNKGYLKASAILNCLSHSGSGMGHCQIGIDGTLNGQCLGVRGGICRSAYDPNNCPLGQPPTSQGQFSCGSSGNFKVDGTRDCTP